METRSQKYARAAYMKVERQQNTPLDKKYGALALNFPAMVLQSGLAQATGFLLAKGKKEHITFIDDLAAVLQDSGTLKLKAPDHQGQAFHQQIINSDLATYLHLTRCTLEAAGWLKRYAQSLLRAEATDGERT